MVSAFEAVRGFYEEAAERLGMELSLRETLATPAREVIVQLRVPMDFGGFKVFTGYRVQYNNARGPFKGGVRVDPKLLSQPELELLARGYMRAIADVIGPHVDIPAPDVNTGPREMGWMADEYSRKYGPNPAVITGKPVVLGGSLGRDAATGRGSVICLERLVRARGWRREDTRVAVQGYGNAGSWLAILLQELGYPIVAVSDSPGAVGSDRGVPAAEVL